MRQARGAALVVTIWIIALATVLALHYSRTVRTHLRITRDAVAAQQAHAAAEAGMWRAVFGVQAADPDRPWPVDGTFVPIEFDGANITVAVQDVAGLVDLNSSPRASLVAVLTHVLADPQRAEELTARILDWRDRDHQPRPYGAEDSDYEANQRDYGAKDGLFNSREELALILGISAEEYQQIAPYVTVYAQKSRLDDRVTPTYMRMIFPVQTQPRSRNTRPRRARTGVFEIFAEAELDGVRRRVSAVVALNSSRRKAPKLAILAWRDSWPIHIPSGASHRDSGAG